MIKVNCSYCGQEIYKKPSQVEKAKHGRLYCNRDCQYAHKKLLVREKVELRIGQDFEAYLFQKYVVERKPTTWIMKDAGIHSHYITNSLKEFGIASRNGSESFNNWWDSISDEEKAKYTEELRERAKKNLNSKTARDNLRKAMDTSEYKEKLAEANGGVNNGMYDPKLPDEHRVQARGVFGYKKWAKKVKERDNYTCQKCSRKGNSRNIFAHHVNDYYEFEDGRIDPDNGVALCSGCHSKFHNKYRGQPATEQLLNEFINDGL